MKRAAESTVRRLSLYLSFLEGLDAAGAATVSSVDLAGLGGTTSAQVRKDLSIFGSFGKRGLGYSVAELTAKLRGILGLERTWRVCIAGAGRIGSALVRYPGFAARGFCIVAAYDANAERIGMEWGELRVRDIRDLARDAARERYDIGVIAVPVDAAQHVADVMVSSGITAIMNFAPAQLATPPHVVIRTVNMALEFEALSFALSNREK